jgi:dTDP-4-amino-4,6-dideoxygalactose transaminase
MEVKMKRRTMKIEIFTPPEFRKSQLDLTKLSAQTGKNYEYAIKGRYAIYHILKSVNAKEKIMLPIYACDSIKNAVSKAGLEYVFYDIDMDDLNASVSSIKDVYSKTKAKYLLVASLYGNPADLPTISDFCTQNKIFMIDDAAQSFGAKIENRYVGTYGDAGLLAFSPGKPTAGHMGSLFWTSGNSYKIKRKKHFLYHYISYLDFYFNRLKIYDYGAKSIFQCFSIIRRCFEKVLDISNDSMCSFENFILGGILTDHLNGEFSFRQYYFDLFSKLFSEINIFAIVKAKRGIPCNHKIVVIMESIKYADELQKFMKAKGVFTYRGYTLLENGNNYPVAKSIVGRIIEFPIENNNKKMEFMFDCVHEYCNRYS